MIELSSDKYIPLRDYAILSKSLIFYEDDWSYNLSVLSSYPSMPKTQNINKEIVKNNLVK